MSIAKRVQVRRPIIYTTVYVISYFSTLFSNGQRLHALGTFMIAPGRIHSSRRNWLKLT